MGSCGLSPAWFCCITQGGWEQILERFWELTMLVGPVAQSGPVSEEGPRLQGRSAGVRFYWEHQSDGWTRIYIRLSCLKPPDSRAFPCPCRTMHSAITLQTFENRDATHSSTTATSPRKGRARGLCARLS